MPNFTAEQLLQDTQADIRYRERRHPQWTDSYLLYRDTVITNRLTQRQSVNVPLMKETIKTQLARVDDPPDIYLEDLASDDQRELLMNEYWKYVAEKNRLELLDIIDKKQVMLYGRSFWKLNIIDGMIRLEILDPQDVAVDRYVNPWDLDSAKRIAHLNIFRSLADLELNQLYDKTAIQRLRDYFATPQGVVKSAENTKAEQDRNDKMEKMGDSEANHPSVSGTIVQLTEIQKKVWEKDEEVVYVIVMAESREILMEKPLRDVLGVNEFTYVTWADDVERTDFWSDGIADIVRVPNQIMNVYFSQLIENGILRGYGMNFYDSTAQEGWTPAGYAPSPFGFYPVPGKPSDVFQHVETPQLQSHLEEMNVMKQMVQSATASTAIETGQGEEAKRTLGEIEILASRASKRITAMNKFSRQRDTDLGDKFGRLVDANEKLLAPVKLFKKNSKGIYYEREVRPSELKSPKGYRCRVVQKAQKEADALKDAQMTRLVAQQFPMNMPLQRIAKERMLSLIDLPPEQKKEVMDYEAQLPPMPAISAAAGATPMLPAPRPPVPDALPLAA